MRARLRSWWQKIKQHRMWSAVIIVASALVIALIVVVVLGYWLNWSWVGVNGGYSKITTTSTTHEITTATEQSLTKTLWDWLQLLIVPFVLAIGGLLFSQMQKTTEQRRTRDNQREAALQAYIDKISELLLKEHLGDRTVDGKLKPEYEQVRNVARVRTITVLTQLDARRIGYVFTFLDEAKLMSTLQEDNAVSLAYADLHAVNWSQANLIGANLSKAKLYEANLSEAFFLFANLRETNLIDTNLSGASLNGADLRKAALTGADLSRAYLGGADLSGADLSRANLSKANLKGVELSKANLSKANLSGATGTTPEQLAKAKSLKGAIMPDGSIHP